MNIFRKIGNFFIKRNNAQCAILSDESGVRYLRDNSEESKFEWKDCRKIVTYKDDLVTSDLICLEFELSNQKVFLVHEEQNGFQQLVEILNTLFPQIEKNWYAEVMQPAFDRNFTILYER